MVNYKRSGATSTRRRDDVEPRACSSPSTAQMARRTSARSRVGRAGSTWGCWCRETITGAVCDDVPGAPAVPRAPSGTSTTRVWAEITDEAVEAVRDVVAPGSGAGSSTPPARTAARLVPVRWTCGGEPARRPSRRRRSAAAAARRQPRSPPARGRARRRSWWRPSGATSSATASRSSASWSRPTTAPPPPICRRGCRRRFADPDDGRGTGRAGPRPVGRVDRHLPRARRAHRARAPLHGRAWTRSSASSTRSRRPPCATQALDEAMAAVHARLTGASSTWSTAAPSPRRHAHATRQAYERLRAAGHERPRIAVAGRAGAGRRAGRRAARRRWRPWPATRRGPRPPPSRSSRCADARSRRGRGRRRRSWHSTAPRRSSRSAGSVNDAGRRRSGRRWSTRRPARSCVGFAAHLERYAGTATPRSSASAGPSTTTTSLLAARRVLARRPPLRLRPRLRRRVPGRQRACRRSIVDAARRRSGRSSSATAARRSTASATPTSTHFISPGGRTRPRSTLRDNHRSQPAAARRPQRPAAGGARPTTPTFAPLVAAARDRPGPDLALGAGRGDRRRLRRRPRRDP